MSANPYVFGAGAAPIVTILFAPFTTDASDTASDPASVSVNGAGSATYGASGVELTPDPGVDMDITFAHATKLYNGSYSGKRVSISVDVNVTSAASASGGQHKKSLLYTSGPADMGWTLTASGGSTTHFAFYYLGGSSETSVGVLSGSHNLEIVFAIDDTTEEHYLDGVLVATHTRGGRLSDDNIRLYAGYDAGIRSIRFKNLLMTAQ